MAWHQKNKYHQASDTSLANLKGDPPEYFYLIWPASHSLPACRPVKPLPRRSPMRNNLNSRVGFYSDAMLMMWRKISNLTSCSKNTTFPALRSLQHSYSDQLLGFFKSSVITLVLANSPFMCQDENKKETENESLGSF